MRRLFLSVGMMALASAAQAQLFTPGSTFDVQTNAAPLSATTQTFLTTGITQSLVNNGLNLQVGHVSGSDRAGAEWLVFEYNTPGDTPISPAQGNWTVNEVGLQLNKAAFLIRAFVQFDVDGTNEALNSSPFGNLSPVSAPPPDLSILSGPGLLGGVSQDTNPADAFQPGPLGPVGTFVNPFSQLNFASVTPGEITSYTEALEFAPVSVGPPAVPEPKTWVMALVGFGLMALLAKRAKTRLALY
jgi:PEP-CTERM motif